jgi:glycosyltransferase involved in cell wall biosynthesis
MPDLKQPRLLFFAYFYPPLGGPAVQRPCKTVKYLTRLGWEVDVITIRDTLYHSKDESLLQECGAHQIIRTASLDPLYLLNKLRKLLHLDTGNPYTQTKTSRKSRIKKLFPIDDKLGWLPFALKAGRQALLTNRYTAVMVTCGPFSSAVAARSIARLGKLPFIMDYRDQWTLNNTTIQSQGAHFRYLQKLEYSCLQSAALVLTATAFMRDSLVNTFGTDLTDKIMPVYSGWDEADFTGLTRQRQPDGKIRIAYLGTLYGERPLTFFLQALKQVRKAHPEWDFEFWLVGNFFPETHIEAENSGILDKIVFIEQQPHHSALKLMLDADILLLVIGGEKNNWVLTGKLFEYLRCRRPILTLASRDSEAAGILMQCGHDAICPITDTAAIRACLEQLFEGLQTGPGEFQIPAAYERGEQIKILSERLKCL